MPSITFLAWVKENKKDVKYYDTAKYAVSLALSLQFNKFMHRPISLYFIQTCILVPSSLLEKIQDPCFVLFRKPLSKVGLFGCIFPDCILLFIHYRNDPIQFGGKKSRRAALDPTAKKQIEPVLFSLHLKCWTTTSRMAWLAVLSRGVRVANDNISNLSIKLYV